MSARSTFLCNPPRNFSSEISKTSNVLTLSWLSNSSNFIEPPWYVAREPIARVPTPYRMTAIPPV